MKYQRSEPFLADWKRPTDRERTLFRATVAQMNEAFARRGTQAIRRWSAALRIKPVTGAAGVWEMTWSHSGPDGGATLEIVDTGGEPAIKWHRIGDHRIFREP